MPINDINNLCINHASNNIYIDNNFWKIKFTQEHALYVNHFVQSGKLNWKENYAEITKTIIKANKYVDKLSQFSLYDDDSCEIYDIIINGISITKNVLINDKVDIHKLEYDSNYELIDGYGVTYKQKEEVCQYVILSILQQIPIGTGYITCDYFIREYFYKN